MSSRACFILFKDFAMMIIHDFLFVPHLFYGIGGSVKDEGVMFGKEGC